jgi:murein hydrolase activator
MGQRSGAGGRTLRGGLIAAVVLVGLGGLPGSLPANLSPPNLTASSRLELQRLEGVRERLMRHQALQRILQQQVRTLAAEIEARRQERERTSAMLQSERAEALALEQRLDWLVPRFLARVAEVRERRVQAAHALANLASKSRQLHLDSTMRARMLAISPLMLERLRSAESGLTSLSALPARAIERHAEIERHLPELMTGRQRLQHEREQKRLQRQVALERLRELDTEVRLLGTEQARLARRFLRAEAAETARAEPQADERALPDLVGTRGVPLAVASIGKAALDRATQLDADAWDGAASQVAAAAHATRTDAGSAELTADAGWSAMPPPAKPLMAALDREPAAVWPSASHDAVSRATTLDVVFVPGVELPGIRAARARIHRGSPPILPVPDQLPDGRLVAHGGPEWIIPAAPGQEVAAPVDGKVVFAGRFKSYGLLLILEHEREYHTLLWGFARLDVQLGEQVQVGQVVGIMDERGNDPPVLHVERRRNGRPVNLAASNNGIQG